MALIRCFTCTSLQSVLTCLRDNENLTEMNEWR